MLFQPSVPPFRGNLLEIIKMVSLVAHKSRGPKGSPPIFHKYASPLLGVTLTHRQFRDASLWRDYQQEVHGTG